ncbi:hypothetical protein EDD86DRAFT_76856 [Gorgonomyces haynaldii]|nr:hypothetical protein EDD86DRAFT_76856 [Gorgonomyces haynaldii]
MQKSISRTLNCLAHRKSCVSFITLSSSSSSNRLDQNPTTKNTANEQVVLYNEKSVWPFDKFRQQLHQTGTQSKSLQEQEKHKRQVTAFDNVSWVVQSSSVCSQNHPSKSNKSSWNRLKVIGKVANDCHLHKTDQSCGNNQSLHLTQLPRVHVQGCITLWDILVHKPSNNNQQGWQNAQVVEQHGKKFLKIAQKGLGVGGTCHGVKHPSADNDLDSCFDRCLCPHLDWTFEALSTFS